jgi:hypothetical protein
MRSIALAAGATIAQQLPAPNQTPPQPQQPSAERLPPPADSPRAPGDDVFVPTEELSADEEVTFPVDI